MQRFIKAAIAGLPVLLASGAAALAQGRWQWSEPDTTSSVSAVPEIDASTGLLAIAAVAAALALAYEMRRRRA